MVHIVYVGSINPDDPNQVRKLRAMQISMHLGENIRFLKSWFSFFQKQLESLAETPRYLPCFTSWGNCFKASVYGFFEDMETNNDIPDDARNLIYEVSAESINCVKNTCILEAGEPLKNTLDEVEEWLLKKIK